jgi:hypothetical protein
MPLGTGYHGAATMTDIVDRDSHSGLIEPILLNVTLTI